MAKRVTSDLITEQMNAYHAPKMEGSVYVHYWLDTAFGEYYLRKTYYTIKDGTVYHIGKENKLTPSGDALCTTLNTCKKVGKFNPEKRDYSPKTQSITHKDVIQIFQRNYSVKS